MEFLKEFATDWILFSLIEGFIFCKFFEKVGGLKKFNYLQVILLSICNCLISQIISPLLYQMLMTVFMVIFNRFKNSNINICHIFKIVCLSMIFFLTTEMIFAMFYDILLNINFTTINKLILFVSMIPIRIIQFNILKYGGGVMKVWMGGVKR